MCVNPALQNGLQGGKTHDQGIYDLFWRFE